MFESASRSRSNPGWPTNSWTRTGARIQPPPSFEELSAAGWFAHDGARLILRANRELPDRAAAELWLALAGRFVEPSGRFDAWFSRLGEDGAVDAPAHLPPESRAALLDEMLRRVLVEPDLGSWTAEWQRAVAELEESRPGIDTPPEPPPADADLTEYLAHWSWIDRRLGEPASGEMRRALDALVHAIVLHDPLDGAYVARAARIARLLEEGRRLPYLVRSVAQSITVSRPATVAALLARPGLLQLGLSLLVRVRLDDDTSIGWSDDPQSRHAKRIRLVWSEGADVALRTLARLPPAEAAAVANQLAGILVPLADQVTADVYFSTQVRLRAEAELRLDETLALLNRLEAAMPRDGRRHRLLPRLVPALAEAIGRRVHAQSPPTGALRLLFWLLDADEREPTSVAAATAITGATRAALRAPSGSWSHDHRAIAALDWGRVAGVLDAQAFESLIAPVPDLGEIEPRSLTNRRRLRMRILARLHPALSHAPARREAVESALAVELAEHAPRGKSEQSNIFERMLEGIGFGADISDLTRIIACAVDSFAPGRREETVRHWLGVTDDPVLLLRAATAMHAADARDLVRTRLEQFDLVKELSDESLVRVAAMAEDAIALRENDLAWRLLNAGDRIFGDDRLREGWRKQSLQPRLMLAAEAADQDEFDRLVKESGEPHEFFRGFLQLRTGELSQAVSTFEKLIEANPGSAAAQLNLFAARLRAAQTAPVITPEDRQRRIELALEAWRNAEATLSPEDRELVSAAASYNILEALDALGRDAEFDRRRETLDFRLQRNRDIDDLIGRVLRRREAAARNSESQREAVIEPLSPGVVADGALAGIRKTPRVDLLILTALTEEAQVVEAVMSRVAAVKDRADSLTFYDYPLKDGRKAFVATASAHQQGAVKMGVFASPLLMVLRPRSATLVGIAAAIDIERVDLGDVPFASQIFSYDDIAVNESALHFRTSGYQVDSRMLRAVGTLKTSRTLYQSWQSECVKYIHHVVGEVNSFQRMQIKQLGGVAPPYLLTEIGAGGPFLLRDRDFRDSLRQHPKEPPLDRVKIAGPVHSKLVFAEMESNGFMAAAHEHEIPATVIKGISDTGDEMKARLEKETGGFYRVFACSNAVLAALHILSHARPSS